MNLPVFDLHCDTATAMLDRDCRRHERLVRRPGHVDLERGGKLTGYVQTFAIFTSPGLDESGRFSPVQIFDAALGNFRKELEENHRFIQQAQTPERAEKIVAEGKIAAVLSIEGTAGIDFDSGRLEELVRQGFAMSTLTWNEQNPLAGSHITGGGLTDRGRDYVRKAQRYGIAIDVSHLSDEAFWDIMDITEKPISASHSNSRTVHGASRNLTDEQFLAICQTGGVAGLNLFVPFLGEEPVTLDTVCDHVLHWLDLGGAEHIALGGDLDGCDLLPADFRGVDDYPALADALLERGVPRQIVEDIFWNNAMRMWKKCCM